MASPSATRRPLGPALPKRGGRRHRAARPAPDGLQTRPQELHPPARPNCIGPPRHEPDAATAAPTTQCPMPVPWAGAPQGASVKASGSIAAKSPRGRSAAGKRWQGSIGARTWIGGGQELPFRQRRTRLGRAAAPGGGAWRMTARRRRAGCLACGRSPIAACIDLAVDFGRVYRACLRRTEEARRCRARKSGLASRLGCPPGATTLG